MKKQACLVCGQELEYLAKAQLMRCMDCGRTMHSHTRCKKGHFICDACHSKRGIAGISRICLEARSSNPMRIAQTMMADPFVYLHGPEHHILVGAALLAAYDNSGGQIARKEALEEIVQRGKQVPGGACGFWGACGAGIGAGIFWSVVRGGHPLSEQAWGEANALTARCLAQIGGIGGPRCCKRNTFLAIDTAMEFVREKSGIAMEGTKTVCGFFARNGECLKERCPFFPK